MTPSRFRHPSQPYSDPSSPRREFGTQTGKLNASTASLDGVYWLDYLPIYVQAGQLHSVTNRYEVNLRCGLKKNIIEIINLVYEISIFLTYTNAVNNYAVYLTYIWVIFWPAYFKCVTKDWYKTIKTIFFYMTGYNSLAPLDVLVLDIKPFSSLFIKAIYLVPETASLCKSVERGSFIISSMKFTSRCYCPAFYKMLFYCALGMSIGIHWFNFNFLPTMYGGGHIFSM